MDWIKREAISSLQDFEAGISSLAYLASKQKERVHTTLFREDFIFDNFLHAICCANHESPLKFQFHSTNLPVKADRTDPENERSNVSANWTLFMLHLSRIFSTQTVPEEHLTSSDGTRHILFTIQTTVC